MNYRKIFNNLGIILLVEAALMVLPVIVAIAYREKTILYFLITMGFLAATGALFTHMKPQKESIYAREGYITVALAWLLMSLFGALPFFLSGSIPNYMDAFFETVSGFTTTGSTILSDIESLPRSILFWRAFTHFIGGMGILVFVIAIIPKAEGQAIHIMRAEVPGPTVGKLVSKIKASARILYAIYIGMTAVLVMLLYFGPSHMSIFESITNAFATAGTGGFCVLNNSIEGYHSHYAEIVIGIFMMLFGVNFNLYYLILKKRAGQALKDEELRWYLSTVAVATLIIGLDLMFTKFSPADAFRLSFFQVSSIISTTGFSSTDFDIWPTLSKVILVLLMFIGGCSGSTGGGMKVSRIAVVFKSSARSIRKAVNPRSVETIKLNGRPVDEETVNGIIGYFAMFVLLTAFSVFIVSFEGKGLDTSSTAVFACINNVGPGLAGVGPSGNFSHFSLLSKAVLSFDMLAGRLELIPVFMFFTRYIIPRKTS